MILEERYLDGEKIFSTKEFAQMLGLTPGTVKQWRSDRTFVIPIVRINNKVYYKESVVIDFMKDREKYRYKPKPAEFREFSRRIRFDF